jgi:hypothetical protein
MSIAGGNSIVLKMNATPKEISNEKDEKELEDDFFNIVRNIAWE